MSNPTNLSTLSPSPDSTVVPRDDAILGTLKQIQAELSRTNANTQHAPGRQWNFMDFMALLAGLVATSIFGAYAVPSYQFSEHGDKVANQANMIALWSLCAAFPVCSILLSFFSKRGFRISHNYIQRSNPQIHLCPRAYYHRTLCLVILNWLARVQWLQETDIPRIGRSFLTRHCHKKKHRTSIQSCCIWFLWAP